MITGVVYNQWTNATRCVATGTVELYEDYSFTNLISSSPIAVDGTYSIPDTPDYTGRLIYVVVRNTSGEVVYSNSFYFYKDAYGNIIDYPDLDIFVNDPSATSGCTPNSVEDLLFCKFYLIRRPCTNLICVYLTSSAPNTVVSYTFYRGSVGTPNSINYTGSSNACYDYGLTYAGEINVCQTIDLYETVSTVGCCGDFISTGSGNLLDTCTYCEGLILKRILPEVNFTILKECCEDKNCFDINTPITFQPSVIYNLDDCCDDEQPQPCEEEIEVSFVDYEIYSYDKPFTLPDSDTAIDDISAPDYDKIYRISLKFNLQTPCICNEPSNLVVESVPNTYFPVLPINPNIITTPLGAYYVLDDATLVYFGNPLDANINTFQETPSVGNSDIDFDLFLLLNSSATQTQDLSFRFRITYCGVVRVVEVVQTIGAVDGEISYNQVINYS